ncbi:putative multiple inositol polyphosphate phosphatase 1 precursor [Danaus plexippus plexippus]|uniref:Multiple inositol polyphosphate phosphatase 1 n=1 Tax=Danaus plexippus plexippus TaxID=278856 RepID=A0A212FEA4_DANPL|nr:putative multiple inositol polyphosphate phosphatase 1 precursor [Danaus plexippus plexippus]
MCICINLPLVYSQCYWNRTPYSYYGSKTPYDATRGDFRDVPPLKGCKLESIWFMARDGARHPDKEDKNDMKDILDLKDDILDNYEDGRGDLCAQDIADLRAWTWNDKLDRAVYHLTPEGYRELLGFGERFSVMFQSLLENLDVSLIRSTKEQRTIKNARSFIEGLKNIKKPIVVDDPILDDPVARLQANVQRRVGLDFELNPKSILSVYNLCRNYRSYSVLKRSPWCALFTDDELMILEYVENITHYYRNGYGHSTNILLGALGLKDLYQKFEEASKGGLKTLTGYFTHETMLHMIYTAMGLYMDYPEVSGLERVKHRKWRTSFLTPFAANFVAVLHRVQFLVNEKELHLCGDRSCSLEEFRHKFQKFNNASYDFCNEDY